MKLALFFLLGCVWLNAQNGSWRIEERYVAPAPDDTAYQEWFIQAGTARVVACSATIRRVNSEVSTPKYKCEAFNKAQNRVATFNGDGGDLRILNGATRLEIAEVLALLVKLQIKQGERPPVDPRPDSRNRAPHLLRHSLATNLLIRGASIFSIKDQLGHEYLQSTIGYIHTTALHLKADYQAHAPSYL